MCYINLDSETYYNSEFRFKFHRLENHRAQVPEVNSPHTSHSHPTIAHSPLRISI